MQSIRHGFLQFFLVLDQLLNVVLSPFSLETWADETMSSRCYRLHHRYPYKVYRVIIDVLFYWQSWSMGHCKRAYESELERYQLPPELRNSKMGDKK